MEVGSMGYTIRQKNFPYLTVLSVVSYCCIDNLLHKKTSQKFVKREKMSIFAPATSIYGVASDCPKLRNRK